MEPTNADLLAAVNGLKRKLEARPKRYAIDRAAEVLGTSRRTLYRRIADGQVRAVRDGGKTYIPASEVDRLAEHGL